MRRFIECCLISTDGIVLDDPFPFRDYDDDAYLRDRLSVFAACDAILWGRTTYERFAKRLPRSAANPELVGHGRPFLREGQAAKLKLAATKSFSKIVKLTYEPQY